MKIKTNKTALIPKLRFPEFKNSGEWVVKRIGDILEYERPDKYIVTSENYVSEGIPVLTANKSFILGYTNEIDNIYANVPVILFDDFTTDMKYVNFPFKVKSSAIKILRAKNYHNLKFIFELLSQIKFDAKEHKRYYISVFQNLTIPLPTLPEQQKIADSLSNLDEWLAAEEEKLTLLETYKKGLLQNLFPAEGETVPKLRFPEFKNTGEWEVKRLGEVGKIVTGSTPSKKDQENWKGNFVWITAQDFKGKYISDSTEKLTDKGKLISRIIPKNAVLVTCIASIGLNAINKVECATNQQINAIICKDKIAYYEFIYYCIVNSENRLKNLAGHTAVPIINKSDFEKFAIPLPTLPEQQKIADCLSALDEQIEAQRQKIELLQQHKKGLLQNLFPSQT
jgi:type I restriction enzyme S subunit